MSEAAHKTSLKSPFARRRKRRLWIVVAGVCILACAVGLIFFALRDTASFFRLPSEITQADRASQTPLRLGGYVEKGSVKRDAGPAVRFRVTDLRSSEPVFFNGILPDLFREGQGVIVEGRFNASGVFIAGRVLAKHDEKYVPKDLADRLKAQDLWEDYLKRDR